MRNSAPNCTKKSHYKSLRILSVLALSASPLMAETNPDDSQGGPFSWGHPITISFGEEADFLSGGWEKNDERRPVVSAMRAFDLDGTGVKMWEWVGPKEGLLVWNEKGEPMFQPTGKELFGFETWGKKWDDGLAALKSLDKDKDGTLSGAELDNLWVWLDANSNAKVDAGELVKLSDKGITSLGLNFKTNDIGGTLVENGAKGKDGSFPILEWWSLGGMTKEVFVRYVNDILADVCVYQWEPTERLVGVEGGLVRYFISEEGGLVGVSLPFNQQDLNEIVGLMVPYVPEEDGTFYSRADMGDTWLENFLTIGEDGTLIGMTASSPKEEEKKEGSEGDKKQEASKEEVKEDDKKEVQPTAEQTPVMKWTAKKVQGPDLDQLLDAATVKLMQQAEKENNQDKSPDNSKVSVDQE